MPPEQQQQLDNHVSEIAKLLYADAQAQGMKMDTLGDIEQTVRAQLQTHVSPELGNFLSTRLLEQTRAIHEPSTASSDA